MRDGGGQAREARLLLVGDSLSGCDTRIGSPAWITIAALGADIRICRGQGTDPGPILLVATSVTFRGDALQNFTSRFRGNARLLADGAGTSCHAEDRVGFGFSGSG